MYPNLYFAFLDLLGWDLPALKLINSFGFFVALAFVVAHGLLRTELKRMTALGHFTPSSRTERIGEPRILVDLGMQALMGFSVGMEGPVPRGERGRFVPRRGAASSPPFQHGGQRGLGGVGCVGIDWLEVLGSAAGQVA